MKDGEFSWPPAGTSVGHQRILSHGHGQTSIIVQICWSDELQCPLTSTEVHSRLTSWLDNWLDLGSFQGQATIQFRGSDGEVIELRLGEE